MRMLVTGVETSSGVSKKSGQPYAIGRIYAAIPLASSSRPGQSSGGYAGTVYDCDPVVADKLAGVRFPVEADLTMQDVLQYGERRQQVVSVAPVTPAKSG